MVSRPPARALLIVYALLNATLYSLLLPLWEGFDEPFHYGYVQHLANGQGLPDPRSTLLSGEIGASLLLAPASYLVKRNLPEVATFADYFSWGEARRFEIRQELRRLPKDLRWQPSQFVNYEAHHPPLAYALLAIPDRLLARVPLPNRIAILRIFVAALGSLLLLFGAERLFAQLGLDDPYRTAALFCILSSQMLWATIAHVANDWLAVPLAVWTLVALISFAANPRRRTAILATLLLAAGLLTKAYLLALVPLLLAVFVWRRRWVDLAIAAVVLVGLAGPWYARNVTRYGVFTGMQEARAGANLPEVVRTAPTLDWRLVIPSSIRNALWSGNNSFLAFSSTTLNLIIATVLLALVLWAATRHAREDWITTFYVAFFLAALAYSAIVSHLATHGASNGPSPWYAQVLLAPLLGLAFLGCSRSPKLGRFVAATLVLLFGYVLAATYVVKLIPLYGGYDGRATVSAIATLYTQRLPELSEKLSSTALAPATVIFTLTCFVILLLVAHLIALLRKLARPLY